MKYCTKCGNAVDDSAEVCPICGERQEPVSNTAENTENSDENVRTYDAVPVGGTNYAGDQNDRPPVRKKYNGLSIASFVLGLICMLFLNLPPLSIVGLVLGIIGTKRFDPAVNKSRWLGIVGIVLNAASIIFTIYAFISLGSFYMNGMF